MSGLKLNADKTEKLNITSQNVAVSLVANKVTYCNTRYLIHSQDDIKINGVTFNQNEADMKNINLTYNLINEQPSKKEQPLQPLEDTPEYDQATYDLSTKL